MCPVCDTVAILQLKKNRVVVTDKYAEGYMGLSNGSLFKFGIDENCLKTLTTSRAKFALERFKSTWHNELVGKGTKRQFDRVKKLKLKHWDLDKGKCLKKMKEKKKDK